MKRLITSFKNPLEYIKSFACMGCDGPVEKSQNRITILSNVSAAVGAVGAILTYSQLLNTGLVKNYLFIYPLLSFFILLIPILNYFGSLVISRIWTVLVINFAAWNAVIFFGKSFNGYYLFFGALVYTILAFSEKNSLVRNILLLISLAGLPLSDYFSHAGIIPVTGLNSQDFPVSTLVSDSIVISVLISIALLVEKFLSDKNEEHLASLNHKLEEIVDRRTRVAMQAKEEADAANKMKSEFVANTSHELRTPLNAIHGFLDLIIEDNLDPDEQKTYLSIIKRNTIQLSQLIDEILDLSKVEAQKLELENRIFEISEVLNDLTNVVSLKAKEKGLEFKIFVDDNVPDKLYSDPLRLKQILINLVGNAVKFTPMGHVHVHVRSTEVNGQPQLEIDVEDTGIGIQSEQRQHVFQPFWQADSGLARQFGGTGLGLALSKHLSELIGGTLELLQTAPGQGSIFRLTMKYQTKYKTKQKTSFISAEKNKVANADLTGRKILIVDDLPDNRELVSRFLILAGADIETAEDGRQALDKIAQAKEPYDIVLMDLQMPVLNGYETTSILRSQQYNAPVVALTAHAMKDEKEKPEALGFNRYLTKPIDRRHLISTLAELTH